MLNEKEKRAEETNVYSFVQNNSVNYIDLYGESLYDLARKRRGLQIPKAWGINAGGVITSRFLPGIEGPSYGIASAIMFFPDACEYGYFSIGASRGKAITEWRKPTKEEAEGTKDFGLTASIGTSAEIAVFIGDNRPGQANAKSFAGVFHTVQASYGISAGGYKGEPLRATGAYWVGGTLGLGPGFGGAKIDWDYKLFGVFNLEEKLGDFGKCLCYSIIAAAQL